MKHVVVLLALFVKRLSSSLKPNVPGTWFFKYAVSTVIVVYLKQKKSMNIFTPTAVRVNSGD